MTGTTLKLCFYLVIKSSLFFTLQLGLSSTMVHRATPWYQNVNVFLMGLIQSNGSVKQKVTPLKRSKMSQTKMLTPSMNKACLDSNSAQKANKRGDLVTLVVTHIKKDCLSKSQIQKSFWRSLLCFLGHKLSVYTCEANVDAKVEFAL